MQRRKPKGDPINGILLLDKHQGVTSNGALQEVKRLLKARKAGHTGSLDPLATGLLPICFGDATKLSSFFLESGKTYRTTFRLGQVTDTGDSDGEVINTRPVNVTADQCLQSLAGFHGVIEQVPPMYSALKVNGQPMYKLARQGIEIERPPRQVSVYDLKLLGTTLEGPSDTPPSMEIEVSCSSGFYVRSLAVDVGEILGCGAHVSALRRTAVGQFGADDMISYDALAELEDIEERRAYLRSPDQGLGHIPLINLSVDAAYYLCRGQTVSAPDLPADLPTAAWVRLYSEATGFLGMGTIEDDGRVAPKRLFQLAG